MLNKVFIFLLPTPTEDEIERFITLYHTKYGIDLDPVEATRMLGGLVRWIYLTQVSPPAEAQSQELYHATQLTARKSGRSRKKQ